MRHLLTALLALAFTSPADRITPREAKNHVGQTKTVCGVVASARYAERTKGSPTFLNLDEPYPRQVFTAVIWGSDRAKFGEPEKTLAGKRVCVTGTLKDFRGTPEIEVRETKQLSAE